MDDLKRSHHKSATNLWDECWGFYRDGLSGPVVYVAHFRGDGASWVLSRGSIATTSAMIVQALEDGTAHRIGNLDEAKALAVMMVP